MRALLLVDGVAALGWGIAFLAVPALVMGLFGVQIDPAGTMLARLLGASLLGVAVTAHAAATGTANALMWGITGLFAILVIWRGYLGYR
jgi:hypothetical protein